MDNRYPILQSYEGAVSYPADLMIRLPHDRQVLSASEMRTVLRCIYFKHYLRWDRPFLPAQKFEERERMINELYSQQIERIGDTDSFGTSGRSGKDLSVLDKHRATIGLLSERIFGPKLPRLIAVICVLLLVQRALHSPLLFIPFVLCAAALYCLSEDTDSSRKLFLVIISKLRVSRQR